MGQLSRDEAGLFDRATAAAIEDRDALSTRGLAATGIDVHQQVADFAAGERRSHHDRGEGHPRQASAVAARSDETAGAAVQFYQWLTVRAPASGSAAALRQWGRMSAAGSAACPAVPHCTWPSDQKKRSPWGPPRGG